MCILTGRTWGWRRATSALYPCGTRTPAPAPQVLVEKCLGRRICKKCGKNYNIADIYLPASADGQPEIVMPPLNPPPECMVRGCGAVCSRAALSSIMAVIDRVAGSQHDSGLIPTALLSTLPWSPSGAHGAAG